MLGEKSDVIIIGKYLRPRCFKNKNLERIHYHANKNAWMKSDIFKHELLKWDSKLRGNNRKILLLVDNCSAHLNINEHLTNIKLVFLPPNTTSVLQPMDAGIIQNFKVNYRKLLIIDLFRCIDQNIEFKPTVFDAIQMIEDAWNKVSGQTITNCFRNSRIGCKNIEKEDKELTTEEFVNRLVKTQSEDLSFFDSRNELNNYLAIDKDIDTVGLENEDEQEIDSKPSITFEMEENNGVDITVALNSLKVLKNFYYSEANNGRMYDNLLEIDQNLHEKYCKRKFRENRITEYFS